MSRSPFPAALRAVLLALPLSAVGCASVSLGAAVGYDAGTVGVSGVETGVGFQAEAIAYPWDGRGFGIGPSVQVAGYSNAGDADPIAFATLDVRYHSVPEDRSRPYLQLGTGVGVALSPGIRHVAVPLQAEVGLERRAGRVTGRIGLRERFVGLVGSGDPALEAFNAVQLVLGLSFGR